MGGCEGIFILGSCGEGNIVTPSFRRQITEESVKIVADRVPLLVGVLECSTQKVIEAIHELEVLGAEYFVVTPPYYLAVENQHEISEHYKAIAASTDKNIVVYNIPPYTHCNIEPRTYADLCKIDNIIAVKDSSGDWDHIQKALIIKSEENFNLLCGNENLSGAAVLFGADGCIPGFANSYPKITVDLYKASQAGDIKNYL